MREDKRYLLYANDVWFVLKNNRKRYININHICTKINKKVREVVRWRAVSCALPMPTIDTKYYTIYIYENDESITMDGGQYGNRSTRAKQIINRPTHIIVFFLKKKRKLTAPGRA